MSKRQSEQSGFTIIELMIATVVFSVVLLIIIYAFMYISSNYIKGYVTSQTQETARSILEEMSQDIQLDSATVYPSMQAGSNDAEGLCIGDHRYSYVLNKELVPGSQQVLVVDNVTGCNSDDTPQSLTGALSSSSKELLGNHMRLAAFSVTPVGSSGTEYTINVSVVYGANSVFNTTNPYTCPVVTLDGEYCAVSTLTTTVDQRTGGGE